MKLFTKDIDKKLFAQFDLGANLETQKVIAKIFNPYGRGTWYIINSDPSDPDYLWAIVDLFEVEAGSVSRSELESIKVPPFGLHLERDSSFTPINAAELYKGLLAGKHYKEGGETEQSENKEMILNQAEELEHHVEELEEAAKKSDHVPAWVVAKVERASTDLSDASHYLDAENEQKREEIEGEEEYAHGGEVKWQEAEYGDSALVVSENKMGIIMKPYGRKFHLKFVDGTEKTYDANDLKFFKDMDDFDRGGYMAEGAQMENGGSTSSPNIEFMKWFDDWSNSVNKYVHVSISIPNEFSSPIKDDNGKIVMLDLIEKKGDSDAKKYMNEILKKADEFGVSIYLEPIPRTHDLKSEDHKKKITKDYLIKYYEKFGFENTDGGFMVREPKMAKGGEIKKGDYVVVDNPYWKASMGKDKPVRRKVTMVEGENVFFSDGSNSSMEYVEKMAEGGWIKSEKQEDFYYYSTPDKKIKTPFWYSVHEVKDIGSKETLHWSVERGGTNNMGYLKNYARKDFKSKDDAFKYAESWAKEVASKFKTSANKMEGGGETDPMATINEISRLSGLRPVAVAEWGDKNNINLSILLKDLKSKKIKGMDLMTAIVGNPNNKYQKELLAKYSRTKMAMGGKVKFADKVASIKASLLKRKKVPKVVQKDYGKTFSPS